MILIQDIESYDLCLAKGFQPLIDIKFTLDINLRVEIQNNLFGKKCPKNDNKFFHWVWNHKPHVCEETDTDILKFAAVHMSHILSKGAFPEMRYDPRNINILLYGIHNIWEFGTEQEKKKLKIYSLNQPIIENLKYEYRQLRIPAYGGNS